jgi:Domain of unknown function (DUF4260)
MRGRSAQCEEPMMTLPPTTVIQRSEGRGYVTGYTALALRLEDAVVLMSATFAYHMLGESWLVFAALFLVPDIMMFGYFVGPRFGAAIYNAGHTYTVPALLAASGYVFGINSVYGPAFIWIAHIGFDRSMGYGLKYNTSFNDTHLGVIGRSRAAQSQI